MTQRGWSIFIFYRVFVDRLYTRFGRISRLTTRPRIGVPSFFLNSSVTGFFIAFHGSCHRAECVPSFEEKKMNSWNTGCVCDFFSFLSCYRVLFLVFGWSPVSRADLWVLLGFLPSILECFYLVLLSLLKMNWVLLGYQELIGLLLCFT